MLSFAAMALERIETIVKSADVVLFMKGTREAPQCGFSASVVEILDEYLDDYVTVNVLADPAVRQAVKEYSDWPTIPQLYVRGGFVGGADIVRDLHSGGELEETLGAAPRATTTPSVTVTDRARDAFRGYHEGPGDPVVRLSIDGRFHYGLELDAVRPGDVAVSLPGLTVVLNRASARRADGLTIDHVEGADGAGFRIDNPNEPPKVEPMSPVELAQIRAQGGPHVVFDVRSNDERALACIEDTLAFDDAGFALLEKLERTTPVVFYCHTGVRSQAAAEHAVRMGFRHVYNLVGGIDAWSRLVDDSVPRY